MKRLFLLGAVGVIFTGSAYAVECPQYDIEGVYKDKTSSHEFKISQKGCSEVIIKDEKYGINYRVILDGETEQTLPVKFYKIQNAKRNLKIESLLFRSKLQEPGKYGPNSVGHFDVQGVVSNEGLVFKGNVLANVLYEADAVTSTGLQLQFRDFKVTCSKRCSDAQAILLEGINFSLDAIQEVKNLKIDLVKMR